MGNLWMILYQDMFKKMKKMFQTWTWTQQTLMLLPFLPVNAVFMIFVFWKIQIQIFQVSHREREFVVKLVYFVTRHAQCVKVLLNRIERVSRSIQFMLRRKVSVVSVVTTFDTNTVKLTRKSNKNYGNTLLKACIYNALRTHL